MTTEQGCNTTPSPCAAVLLHLFLLVVLLIVFEQLRDRLARLRIVFAVINLEKAAQCGGYLICKNGLA